MRLMAAVGQPHPIADVFQWARSDEGSRARGRYDRRMNRRRATATATLLAMAISLSCGGCAAIPLAVLGTAAGIAATAVSTGADVYSLGKLDAAEMASFREVCNGVGAAADDLSLHLVSTKVKDRRLIVRLADDQKATIDVTVEPRTARLTRLRIDVGLFGSEPTARLLLKRIRNEYTLTNEGSDLSDDSLPTLCSGPASAASIGAGSMPGARGSRN